MWTAGYLARIALAAASTCVSLLTSQAIAIAALPIVVAVFSAAALSRSTQATVAPASAKASAIARPMPLPAPVTTADLPASEYLPASVMTQRSPRYGRDRLPARED